MHKHFILALLAGLLMCCTQFGVSPDGTVKGSTFGSAWLEATVDTDGRVLLEAQGDGTNIMAIFTGLFDSAARFFGGGSEPPNITINLPQPEVADTNPDEAAPTN
jgi:hypothetical protein